MRIGRRALVHLAARVVVGGAHWLWTRSGGFQRLPDLVQALNEFSRVSAKRATLTVSTFAEGLDDLHTVVKRWMKQRFDLHFAP